MFQSHKQVSADSASAIKKGMLPPGPRGYPLVGVLPKMLRDPFRFATGAVREVGDICTLNLGFGKTFLLGHPDYAQYVMRDHAANFIRSGGMWEAARMLFGRGLITNEGPFWLRQRRMMQPQFHRQKLARLCAPMIESAAIGLEKWHELVRIGKPIELFKELMPITMKIILKTMFTSSISDAETEAISEDVTYCFEYMRYRTWTYFLPTWAPFPGTRRFEQAIKNIDRILYRIIDERRKNPGEIDDLLTFMLQARDEETGTGMTDQHIRDEAMTLFLAGHETTTTALSWAFYLLGQHPQVMQSVLREVETVLGDRTPTFDSFGQLTYTRMAFQEAMRIYPPAWMIHRTAIDEDQIGGYRIPAGSIVVILIYALHHHPEFWDSHSEFRPERFSAEAVSQRHPCAYLPFSIGAHQCIGNIFTIMESVLIMAMTLQRFSLKLIPGQRIEPKPIITIRPSNGVWVTLEPRPTRSTTATAQNSPTLSAS